MLKSLLQTDFWAEFKKTAGWSAHRYEGLLGLTRGLPFGRKLTYFPEINLEDSIVKTIESLRARPEPGRMFSRFDFIELWTHERASELIHLGLVKSFEEIQPEYRQWVLLDKSEEELLKQMKPKGRYNIGVANRHHLNVSFGITDESIKTLFELYQQTSKRTGFQGRGLVYFQQLAHSLKEHELGEIITVRSKEGEVLAALLLSFYGGICSYLYGGSGGDRSLMGPYLAHWEAMKQAKKRDCVLYDLLAIAPPEEPNHPHAGLSRFKSQFGGNAVRLLGSWDLVESPFWYTIYRLAQRRRRRVLT